MKAISVRQPFATLLAHGKKLYETRSWPIPFLGKFAIHASQLMTKNSYNLAFDVPEVRDFLRRNGIHRLRDLPRGQFVGVGEFTDCKPTFDIADNVNRFELFIGDFRKNRFAWKYKPIARLPDIEYFKQPGQKGIFNVDDNFFNMPGIPGVTDYLAYLARIQTLPTFEDAKIPSLAR